MKLNSKNEPQGESFTLEVPPDSAYLTTIRLFAGSVARHYECAEETIDDLKVALTEACTNAITRPRDASTEDPNGTNLKLSAALDGPRLAFTVRDGGYGLSRPPGKGGSQKLEAPTEEITRVLGIELINALFPEAELITNSNGGTDIRFLIDIAGERS